MLLGNSGTSKNEHIAHLWQGYAIRHELHFDIFGDYCILMKAFHN